MRQWITWWCLLVIVSFVILSGAEMADQAHKIDAELRSALQQPHANVDIMVQLVTPPSTEPPCDCASTADRANCVVTGLQEEAERAQREIKAVLTLHKRDYSQAEFFWINNSVSIKQASAALVSSIATLESVSEIHLETILDTM